MAEMVMMDELRIVLTAPPGLDPDVYAAVRRTLDTRAFKAGLRRAVRAAFARYPELTVLTVVVEC